eukprot:Pgem_evm1s14199
MIKKFSNFCRFLLFQESTFTTTIENVIFPQILQYTFAPVALMNNILEDFDGENLKYIKPTISKPEKTIQVQWFHVDVHYFKPFLHILKTSQLTPIVMLEYQNVPTSLPTFTFNFAYFFKIKSAIAFSNSNRFYFPCLRDIFLDYYLPTELAFFVEELETFSAASRFVFSLKYTIWRIIESRKRLTGLPAILLFKVQT